MFTEPLTSAWFMKIKPDNAADLDGLMDEVAYKALIAGCDMVLVCNNRDAAVQTLHELAIEPDPVSLVRLARLHALPGLNQQQLIASPQWQSCRAALSSYQEATQFSI